MADDLWLETAEEPVLSLKVVHQEGLPRCMLVFEAEALQRSFKSGNIKVDRDSVGVMDRSNEVFDAIPVLLEQRVKVIEIRRVYMLRFKSDEYRYPRRVFFFESMRLVEVFLELNGQVPDGQLRLAQR